MSKFWLEDPLVLVKCPEFFPRKTMTKAEKLNALTRLSIVVTCIMYGMNYEYWLSFLVISILFVVILFYSSIDCEINDTQVEGFTIVPTYAGNDFEQTIVAPTFAEEWQIPPPAYDLYTNVPSDTPGFEEPLTPKSYPYGQYLTTTNLLPSDEYQTHMMCGGATSAREYANSAFLRHYLAYKDNMTRLYKKKLNRRFRGSRVGGTHSDTFSPYSSY